MPSKSLVPTVPVKAPPFGLLPERYKDGYTFVYDRWEGEQFYANARMTSLWFQSTGWTSNVYEGESETWEKGKKIKAPYFRVYLVHPENPELYAWWAPTASEWNAPIQTDELTWFEFVKADEKKK